jgi:hypothetical protein
VITFFSEVCEEAYLMVYDIRKKRLDEIKLLFSKGVKRIIHGNEGRKKTRVGTTTALGKSLGLTHAFHSCDTS